MSFFETNTSIQVARANKRLKQIKKGISIAAGATLDNMAFESKQLSTKEFVKDHVIRSNWTQRGMLFEKAKKGVPIARMESRSGNIRPYARDLEIGAKIKANNEYLPIPALGARVSKSKRKRIAKKFSMPNLNARRLPNVRGNAKQKFAAMLNIARKENNYGPFLIKPGEAGGSKLPTGIFTLGNQGRKKRGGGKITMIRKLQKSAIIKGHSFIGKAGIKIGGKMDKIYVKNAKRILRKYGRDIR